jgi:ATP-dependent DNA ligase
MTLPKIDAMDLIQTAKPFDDPDWLFEVKYDGFRSLAYIENGTCKLVSRNEYDYKRFADLRDTLPDEINAKDAILNGELVVLDSSGKARFYDLMAGRGTVVFAAFDLLWLNGRDMRDLTLLERKEILHRRLRFPSSRVIFVDHIQGRGKALYLQICKMDLEGIVCKPAISPYRTIKGKTTSIMLKNPNYSQGRTQGAVQQTAQLRRPVSMTGAYFNSQPAARPIQRCTPPTPYCPNRAFPLVDSLKCTER